MNNINNLYPTDEKGMDILDIKRTFEYVDDLFVSKKVEAYKLSLKIEEIELLKWKLCDLNRLIISSVDFHDKINELINNYYNETNTEIDKIRNNSFTLLNIAISLFATYTVLIDIFKLTNNHNTITIIHYVFLI